MNTCLDTRQNAYRFDETAESVIKMRNLSTACKLSTFYVCGYNAMENTVPLYIIVESCNFDEAKKLLKKAVAMEVETTNDSMDYGIDEDAYVGVEDFIEYFVIYAPNADVFIAFDEDVENIIGIHPANFLKDNKYEVIVKPEE